MENVDYFDLLKYKKNVDTKSNTHNIPNFVVFLKIIKKIITLKLVRVQYIK